MKLLRDILLWTVLAAAWLALSCRCLGAAIYRTLDENAACAILSDSGDGEFRKAVTDASRSIEAGFQVRTTSGGGTAVAKRVTGGGAPRIPVSSPDFTNTAHGKVPLIIRTAKTVYRAASHARDFYVIALRHLII